MIKYKQVITKNGRTQYWKNGKMVSVEAIPQSIVNILEPGVELQMPSEGETVDQSSVDNTQLDQEEETTCIFCGKPSNRKRFVNLKIAILCDEHYSGKTTGEVVAQVRFLEEDQQ